MDVHICTLSGRIKGRAGGAAETGQVLLSTLASPRHHHTSLPLKLLRAPPGLITRQALSLQAGCPKSWWWRCCQAGWGSHTGYWTHRALCSIVLTHTVHCAAAGYACVLGNQPFNSTLAFNQLLPLIDSTGTPAMRRWCGAHRRHQAVATSASVDSTMCGPGHTHTATGTLRSIQQHKRAKKAAPYQHTRSGGALQRAQCLPPAPEGLA